MQLKTKSKLTAGFVELAVLIIFIALNISFLHGAGILCWGYFNISGEVSGYGLYFISTIGTMVISKKLSDKLVLFLKIRRA
ncbi:hypothetical protein [uncultured Pantoea sp.]|uniref:hypothetical protein n=1 Tax=uncultured Pantoea sp. TaxID=218084 RepID=UPI00258592D7|nr:hypothetical protein [uncultured Pantoea sp.]